MYCIDELDVNGKPFWAKSKIFGSLGHDNRSLMFMHQSCGSTLAGVSVESDIEKECFSALKDPNQA